MEEHHYAIHTSYDLLKEVLNTSKAIVNFNYYIDL